MSLPRRRSATLLSPIEIRLEPFQERLLELIEVSRQQGYHRNLLVSATGTGKTVMAAIDYARLRSTLSQPRLLFVAHREEILDQSRATFRHALRDYNFGEKWVGGARPEKFEHVFASVQSLTAANLDRLPPEHFDVVVIDEFHHAAANSYRSLIERLEPKELLGLTATILIRGCGGSVITSITSRGAFAGNGRVTPGWGLVVRSVPTGRGGERGVIGGVRNR